MTWELYSCGFITTAIVSKLHVSLCMFAKCVHGTIRKWWRPSVLWTFFRAVFSRNFVGLMGRRKQRRACERKPTIAKEWPYYFIKFCHLCSFHRCKKVYNLHFSRLVTSCFSNQLLETGNASFARRLATFKGFKGKEHLEIPEKKGEMSLWA